MKLRDMLEVISNSGYIRYEIYSDYCDGLIASDQTLHDAILFGLDCMLDKRVDYLGVVHTEKQPETLQIYLR